MQHPVTDTSSPGPCSGKEKQTVSVYIPLMIRTKVSHNSKITASTGNPVSSVQAGDNGNMFPILADQQS